MADINPRAAGSDVLDDREIVELVELIFFAYRDFTSDPDVILATFGFGRAHHRVIHFVGRHPGMRVAELLEILRITKQSLARVLKELVGRGFIVQRTGEADRRQRLLFLTRQGGDLHQRLMAPQIERIRAALGEGGGDVRGVLFRLIDAEDRGHVLSLLDAAAARSSERPA
jgi:DNA-binding MarR family transcriptional regulator